MSLRAFLSRRVVTPDGVRPGAVLVEGEQIREVVGIDRVLAAGIEGLDFGDSALLPGLNRSISPFLVMETTGRPTLSVTGGLDVFTAT